MTMPDGSTNINTGGGDFAGRDIDKRQGVFNTYTEATSHPYSLIISNGTDAFVSDTWRATKKLTLDYGMRISWYQPFHNYTGLMAGFVLSKFDPKQAPKLIQPAIVGGKSVGVHPVTGQTYPSALVGFIAPGTGNVTNGMVLLPIRRDIPRGWSTTWDRCSRRASVLRTILSVTARPPFAAASAFSTTGRSAPIPLPGTPIRWSRRR